MTGIHFVSSLWWVMYAFNDSSFNWEYRSLQEAGRSIRIGFLKNALFSWGTKNRYLPVSLFIKINPIEKFILKLSWLFTFATRSNAWYISVIHPSRFSNWIRGKLKSALIWVKRWPVKIRSAFHVTMHSLYHLQSQNEVPLGGKLLHQPYVPVCGKRVLLYWRRIVNTHGNRTSLCHFFFFSSLKWSQS